MDKSADKENQSHTPDELEGGGPSPAESANVEQIASDLSGNMPDVQEHAIVRERTDEQEKAQAWAHLKDRDGAPFDPSVHKTNRDGEPTLSAGGKLVKKPGRKPGQKTATGPSGSRVVSSPPTDTAANDKMQARAAGNLAANMVLQIGIVAGGEEWYPRQDKETGLDEKTMLENAFADYFEATGKTDIPPGFALTVALGGYALPRFTMPKTQSRMKKLQLSLKQWWIDRKLKKHGLKAEPIPDKKGDPKKSDSTSLEA